MFRAQSHRCQMGENRKTIVQLIVDENLLEVVMRKKMQGVCECHASIHGYVKLNHRDTGGLAHHFFIPIGLFLSSDVI